MELSNTGDLARHLPSLLERAGVETVHLDVLTKRPSFKGAEVSARAQEITGPAREEHRRRHFGFWEYVLSAAIDTDPDTRAGLIEGALRHHDDETSHTQMSLSEFTDSMRGRQFSDLPARTIVSLTSSVGINTDPAAGWHLPMLDLGAPVGPAGQEACLDALHGLGVTGLLFDSGKSYHFYADQVLSERGFWKFLARATTAVADRGHPLDLAPDPGRPCCTSHLHRQGTTRATAPASRDRRLIVENVQGSAVKDGRHAYAEGVV